MNLNSTTVILGFGGIVIVLCLMRVAYLCGRIKKYTKAFQDGWEACDELRREQEEEASRLEHDSNNRRFVTGRGKKENAGEERAS